MKILSLFAAALLLSCALPQEEVRVGAMLVLTGESASWGEASRNAIEMAMAEANAQGGIGERPIRVIYEDTQESPAKAIAAYRKLRDIDEVVALIGPNWQTEVSAIAPLAAQDGFPVITPSYAPIENRPDPRNPLLIWMDPGLEAQRIAQHVQDSGARSVAVVGTQDGWERQVSSAFAERFSELGGDVVFFELLQADSEDVRTAITRAMAKDPDAIFLGTYFQFLNLVRSLEERGYAGEIYSIEIDDYLAEQSAESGEGIAFISLERYEGDFCARYEERFSQKCSIPAGQAYDAANLLLDYLEEDPSGESLVESFRSLSSYEGVSGTILIENHSTLMPTALYEIRDGGIVRIEALK